jgi:hypothetical protein
MRRVPVTLWWKAGWWVERSTVDEFEGYHAEGACAYAFRQAELLRRISDHFEELWAPLRAVEDVAAVPEPMPEPIDGNDDEADDDNDDEWVDAESEGEGGLEGEDEEGSLGEEEEVEDDE